MLNVNARGAQARKHNVMRAAAAGCIGCQAETHVLILGSPAALWEVKAGSVRREREREGDSAEVSVSYEISRPRQDQRVNASTDVPSYSDHSYSDILDTVTKSLGPKWPLL